MRGIVQSINRKIKRLGRRMESYQEAVTFAEAGEHDYVRASYPPEDVVEPQGPLALLVVGRESGYSNEVVDYALDMAKRLSYKIVALNTAPLSCETFRLFSSSHQMLCREFQNLSEKSVAAFRKRAEEMGIPFVHAVKFVERERAVEEVIRECGGVDFVISDTEENRTTRAADRPEMQNRTQQPIYVYSVL